MQIQTKLNIRDNYSSHNFYNLNTMKGRLITMREDLLNEEQKKLYLLLKYCNYNEAINQCVYMLGKNVLDKQTWCNLGEALLKINNYKMSRKCFERALLLDPQALWIDTVTSILGDNYSGQNIEKIDKLLETHKVSISAGILVKDEARSIRKCLEHLIGAVDEIIVVDTGSTDDSIKIITEFKNKYSKNLKLFHFPWCNDFSAARNFALEKMTSDWVIWIDADEYLFEEDVKNLHTATSIFNSSELIPILKIGIFNTISGDIQKSYDYTRMFPLNRKLKYTGKIHEQLSVSNNGYISTSILVRLLHDGYERDIIKSKNKLERNINLLKEMVKQEPDNPGWRMFLGRETFVNGQIDEAIEILLEAEQFANKSFKFARKLELYTTLIKAYLNKADYFNAEKVCERALAYDKNFPDILYYDAFIKVNKSLDVLRKMEIKIDTIKENYRLYRGSVSPDENILNFKADLLLADIKLFTSNTAEANELYKRMAQNTQLHNYIDDKLAFIEKTRILLNKQNS